MAGTASMIGTLAGIFQMLPTILAGMQVLIYVVAILFFGSIAILGYRGFLTRLKKLALRLVLGAICLVTGTAITPFLNISDTLLKIVQLDLFIGMLVSSIVLLVVMKLMTMSVPYSAVLKERIRRLQEKLEKRKDKDAKMPEDRLRRPATIAGLVIFIGFIAFSLVNFHGFPDMKQSIFSSLGISDSDMAKINEAMDQFLSSPLANLSADCLSTLEEIQGKEGLQDTVYENDAVKSMIEQAAGSPVSEMYRLESGGKTLINAAMASGRHCFATLTEFCICY